MFRNFANIRKGSNLTIFCILRMIAKWQELHPKKKYPDEIYIQIDGGAENANKCVPALCEYLVAKGITKRIVLTRLPVGHTHEDIDACFGVIYEWFKTKSIYTPQQYKHDLEESLRMNKNVPEVEDIFVIPDYKKVIMYNIYYIYNTR